MNPLKSSAFKIDKRVYLVFTLVVTIAITNAVLSTLKIRKNKNTIYEITEVTTPTVESLEEFNLMVNKSRMFITNWVYLPNNRPDKTNLVLLNKNNYPELKSRISKLTKEWQSNQNVTNINTLFNNYEEMIGYETRIMNTLSSVDDYNDPSKKFQAEGLLENEIIPRTNNIMLNLRNLIELKKENAIQLQNQMQRDNMYLLLIVFALAVLIIISVMLAGYYMMKKIVLPLLNVRESMLKMSNGELPDVKVEVRNNAIGEMTHALQLLRDRLQRTSSFADEIGRSNFNAPFEPLNDRDVLGVALLDMRDKLKALSVNDQERKWTSDGAAMISAILHKNTNDISKLCEEIIHAIISYINAHQGVIYLVNDDLENDPFIEPVGWFAPGKEIISGKRIELKEGLIGQVISSNEIVFISGGKETGNTILTGLTNLIVSDICIAPLFAGGKVIGAIEIKSLEVMTADKRNLMKRITEPIASNILTLKSNELTRKLLIESQTKTRELAQQDEELRQINNELMLQSRRLKISETELRKQQETLQRVNDELEKKALLLEEKNMAVEDAHKALAFKAEQLERTSKYKSEFLANMSHELRTPLNSVLILAKLLSENKSGNMNEKQVEHAHVIHKSGADLLVIINDILDLSKIEAGRLELNKEEIQIDEICNNMNFLFNELSIQKQVQFNVVKNPEVGKTIYTDRVRLEQILKNLLSNAFKFTSSGGEVSLEVSFPDENMKFRNYKLNSGVPVICFSVKDSGIGIPADKQKLIFEAFHQGDGSITRRYGGTGLGLAISKQLVGLLGGDIVVESIADKGSEFKIFLPLQATPHNETHFTQVPENKNADDSFNYFDVLLLIDTASINNTGQWKNYFETENKTVQVIDDRQLSTITFRPALIIIDRTSSDKDYVATINSINENHILKNVAVVVRSVSEFVPTEIQSDITLHTTKPVSLDLVNEILGLIYEPVTVLKQEPMLRTVPVQTIIPSNRNQTGSGNNLEGKKILIADDDMRNIYSLTTILESEGAEVFFAMDGREAIGSLKENPGIQMILMDIMMPNMDGYQAMQEIRKSEGIKNIPIIAVTAKAMRGDREICIRAGANEYITKPVQVDMLIEKILEFIL